MEIRRCKDCPAMESKPGGREGGFPICICHLRPAWAVAQGFVSFPEVREDWWCIEGQGIGKPTTEGRRARIEALITEREQMLAGNQARERNGEAQMYGEQQFADLARLFNELATS